MGTACSFCHAGKDKLTVKGEKSKTAFVTRAWATEGTKSCLECHEGVEGDVNKDYDVIIIGGGPAALAAAVYTCRALLKTIIIEKKYLGGQLVGTELIENYPGFPEVIGGVELTQRMEAQAKRFGVEIRYEEVLKLDVENGLKVVTTEQISTRAI